MVVHVNFTHPGITKILQLIPNDTKTLLDIGCGKGIIGSLVRIYRKPKRIVGIDIFKPYIKFCKKFRIYDEVLEYDLNNLPLPFKSKSFDIVTMIEIIEHLPKQNALKLIYEAERIAKKAVIISTPNIRHMSLKQLDYDNNPFQKHLSFFSHKELRKLGYKTYVGAQLYLFGIQIPFLLTVSEPTKKKYKKLSDVLNNILLKFSSNTIAVKKF